jgi:hypothetical protein
VFRFRVFDLKLFGGKWFPTVVGVPGEHWPDGLFSTHGASPLYEFQKCVTRYRGDYQQKGFSCSDQFLAMGFAQFGYRESLRDIELKRALDSCASQRGARLEDLRFPSSQTRHKARVVLSSTGITRLLRYL